MPYFQYTAKNEHGETVEGKVDARHAQLAVQVLRNRGLFVITIKSEAEPMFGTLGGLISGIKSKDISNFTRQLSTMITAGLPLTDSLDILRQQSKPALSKILSEVSRDIESGNSFSKSLGRYPKHFSKVYVQLIKAGESAGILDQMLERLAINMEKDSEFRSKTRGALIYPVIVIIAMVVVTAIMMVFVLPRLAVLYEDFGSDLPIMTRGLIALSNFSVRYWWVLAALVLGGVVGFRLWSRRPGGSQAINLLLFKVPIMGELRKKIVLTEFTRTLSLLLGAGISLLQALETVGDAASSIIYRQAIVKASNNVEKGVSLAETLSDRRLWPLLLQQMIAVGEETGKLDDVLMKVSVYFEKETEQDVKNLTAAFEPLIMIVLGIGVGLMTVSIIMPIYTLTTQF
ncbi:MAG: hypothetical protein COU69_00900 [Candidatus Pacebacteria bacterium CG10_big_fil_rev_8_21_14_0_10_56_10]|nr:MAG: hypothetical protein COU69_00900 [Candidatus Pacebacteria bacterium CG10_big_fil_rev_8_21_14_0_10_56_10]